MSAPAPVAGIKTRFPGAVLDYGQDPESTALTIAPARLVDVCEFLRDDPASRYDLLVVLAVAPGHLLYQLASLSHRRRLQLRVPIGGGERPEVESVAYVWPAANWAEREAHDLWGVVPKGHPDLCRIFVPASASAASALTPTDGAQCLTGTRFPSSIDGLRIDLEVDAGRVQTVTPRFGSRHSGVERRLTEWSYGKGLLLAARIDGFSAMSYDLAYAMAVEQLLGIEPPPRAQTLRTIYSELQRIASHLYWFAHFVQALTEPPFAAPAYAWQARSAFLDLFQWLGGNPLTPDLVAIGGLTRDAPSSFRGVVHALIAEVQSLLDNLRDLVDRRTDLRARLRGLAVIDAGTALGLGVTGPNLRACGIDYDVRRAFPYADYASLDMDVPTSQAGDTEARYEVRLTEMRTSLQIIDQAFLRLRPGSINVLGAESPPAELPAGTVYASVEGPRGEAGVLLVSQGTPYLSHARLRAPSVSNLSALPYVCQGMPTDQVATALRSLDVSMSEVER